MKKILLSVFILLAVWSLGFAESAKGSEFTVMHAATVKCGNITNIGLVVELKNNTDLDITALEGSIVWQDAFGALTYRSLYAFVAKQKDPTYYGVIPAKKVAWFCTWIQEEYMQDTPFVPMMLSPDTFKDSFFGIGVPADMPPRQQKATFIVKRMRLSDGSIIDYSKK